ncbi:MAG TPA: TatD family hydrolase [Acidimicrobiia bacterium]|nr:TatD family hydrolase [Acidimicrobiia bacterium]
MTAWVDSHCHLPSLSGGAEAALERARAAGVAGVVCVGTDAESSEAALALAGSHHDVRATVGLHPHDASRLAAEWERLEALAGGEGVVAVGETGFDLHYRHSSPEEQEAAFRAQIALAHRLDRALVIHTRDAWDDTFRVLDDARTPERTVFHCFTGGAPEARRALGLGAYVSFSGIVSFKNATDVRAAAAIVPLDRMLVETDAPYLAPVPHRGRENEPAWVVDVGAALAVATGRPAAELADATRSAAATVFGPFGGRGHPA